jgi:hypothetical protein
MTTKIAQAKERQQYTDKLIPSTCSNCAHFQSKVEERKSTWGNYTWTHESQLRCGIGGFKVKKLGSCSEWAGKEQA